jgi:polyvinyl alcohol dehydrogenase (cytochrome)
MRSSLISRARALAAVAVVTAVAVGAGVTGAAPPASWTTAGNGVNNWRSQPAESTIGTANVATLAPKWIYRPGGDVSATPAVDGGAVYVPDWTGHVSKLDAATGAVIWRTELNALTGIPEAEGQVVSRTTPTIQGSTVLIGTQRGARLIALDKTSGAVQWITTVDANPFAVLTQSPVIFNNVIYQGVSSTEEGATAFIPNYPCCFFRGNVNAISLKTGAVLWTTYLTPPGDPTTNRYSGNAVWGSTPVVDVSRSSLYITTGNNYSVPDDVAACEADPDEPLPCDVPTNYTDAILGLDLATGAVKWADKLEDADAWNVACIFPVINGASCPTPTGPDYDFGQGPMLLKAKVAGKQRDVLVAGQKSGVMTAVDPSNGAVLWATQAGPGGTLGGIEWGSATDGKRIYFAIANNGAQPYVDNDGNPRPGLGTAGSWGAIDPATGAIIWQVPDPNGAIDTGAVSVANGVVYGGSMAKAATAPTFFALDAATGQVRWNFASGGSVNAGPAIANGVVYWGSGYTNLGTDLGSGNDAFYALSPGGR